MQLKKLAVLGLRKLACDHYWIELENDFSETILPGQFLNLRIDSGLFLRRPFSVAGADRTRLALLFKVKGRGTGLLARKKRGDVLDALGPLGNGYPLSAGWRNIWLIGGGTGLAPLLFLSKQLLAEKRRVTILCGARSKQLLFTSLVPKGCHEFGCATDDGTRGCAGSVVGLAAGKLESGCSPDVIYAGGPVGMLRGVAEIAARYRIPAYVSVENRMACGTGVCFGCVVKIRNDRGGWDHVRVCKEGPVFPAEKVIWENDE